MKTVCTFVFFKETPGAWRYKQTEQNGVPVGGKSDDALIGTLYVRKAHVQGEPPPVLTITVEAP